MITRTEIMEILFNNSAYIDSSLGNVIGEEKYDDIANQILTKLGYHDNSEKLKPCCFSGIEVVDFPQPK